MKKTILLLMLCIGSLYIHAQQIDTTLLYGRWDLYSLRDKYESMCRDSMAEYIRGIKDLNHNKTPVSYTDSVKNDADLKNMLDDYFKTYMIFEHNGTITMMLGYEKDEYGVANEMPGTYVWSAANKMVCKIGKHPPEVFEIRELTKKKLVIASIDKSGKTLSAMIFTRAK